ncbi:MAG TPA: hypothetical protein VF407_13105, partial [Polyangiaceae bacterium]
MNASSPSSPFSRFLSRTVFASFVGTVALVSACSSSSNGKAPANPVTPVSTDSSGLGAFVDPFLGTGDAQATDPVANGLSGATFPGAAAPFGMVQFSPDTPNTDPPGYHYTDSDITGFSLTHLNGAGCPAERDMPLFPFAARPDFTVEPD